MAARIRGLYLVAALARRGISADWRVVARLRRESFQADAGARMVFIEATRRGSRHGAAGPRAPSARSDDPARLRRPPAIVHLPQSRRLGCEADPTRVRRVRRPD